MKRLPVSLLVMSLASISFAYAEITAPAITTDGSNVTTLPGEVNAVAKGDDAQTQSVVDSSNVSAKVKISGNLKQLKVSIEHAQDLSKALASTQDRIEQNRISREINIVARDIELEKSYLEEQARTESSLQHSPDYQNLLGDISSSKRAPKNFPLVPRTSTTLCRTR